MMGGNCGMWTHDDLDGWRTWRERRLQKELLRFGSDPLEAGAGGVCEDGLRGGGRGSRRCCWISVCYAAWGIFMQMRVCGRQRFIRRSWACNLDEKQVKLLYKSLQEILRNAIVMRGSSISDFLDAEGQPGEYQRHHRVYGREAERCFRCRTEIRRGIVAGRSSYYCPVCQKAPRGWKGAVGKRTEKKKVTRRR